MSYTITSKQQYANLMIEFYGENENAPGKWKVYHKVEIPSTLGGVPFNEVNTAMQEWLKQYPTYEEMPDGV